MVLWPALQLLLCLVPGLPIATPTAAVQSAPSLLRPETRIVGGVPADIRQCPYLAQLELNGRMLCGAALISLRHALTAAHCTQGRGTYTLRAATSLLGVGGVTVHVRLVLVHPRYDPYTASYDIAALRLAAPLPAGPALRPVCLPPPSRLPPRPGTLGTVAGWGATDPQANGMPVRLLRRVRLPVTDALLCQARYMGAADPHLTFCAGYRTGGRDACQGDSGGPFVVGNVLLGIVSFGIGCAEAQYPGVYTNVASMRGFIRSATGL